MILLDTHIWIWWVSSSNRLTSTISKLIHDHQSAGLGISIISCWEIAKKVELGKIVLDRPVEQWIDQALGYTGVQMIGLSPRIVVESTQLPGTFHRDPADQLIVATARVLDVPLLTEDAKLLDYAHVRTPQ